MKSECKIHEIESGKPGRYVLGFLLEEGDVLQENDVYAGSSGKWELCPCPGLKIQPGCSTQWVRRAR